MATTKVSNHSRSISLPTRSHPISANVKEIFDRLRASDEASSSSFSLKCNKLIGLKDLYECVDDLLKLPTTQQNLSGCAENFVAASLRLLDLCNVTKDAFSQMRAYVQDLESSLRRREADVSSKVGSYFLCMRKTNKMVSKCFMNIKKLSNNKNQENVVVVKMLKEVEDISVTIFESLLSSLCNVKETSKNWFLVSKLMKSKRVSCEVGSQEDMHMVLEALYKSKSNKETDLLKIKEAQKCLIALNMDMQQCEEDLDCLYRSLIKTRVSLLNVLNH